MPGKEALTEELTLSLAVEYEAGATLLDLQAYLREDDIRVELATIRQAIGGLVEIRSRGRRTIPMPNLRANYEALESTFETGEIYGAGKEAVRRRLISIGVPRTGKPGPRS